MAAFQSRNNSLNVNGAHYKGLQKMSVSSSSKYQHPALMSHSGFWPNPELPNSKKHRMEVSDNTNISITQCSHTLPCTSALLSVVLFVFFCWYIYYIILLLRYIIPSIIYSPSIPQSVNLSKKVFHCMLYESHCM